MPGRSPTSTPTPWKKSSRAACSSLDVPEHQIGLPDASRGLSWALFHPNGTTGGSVIGDGIAVNSGVLNPELLTERYGPGVGTTWAKSRLRDRIDAVIAHEIAEGRAGSHEGAEALAAGTEWPVSEGARRILRLDGGEGPMIHNITAGHFGPDGSVTKPMDRRVVERLLRELGDGTTLCGWAVRFEDGCVILPWKGGVTNRVAEEFAIRLRRETGCAWPTASTGASSRRTNGSGWRGNGRSRAESSCGGGWHWWFAHQCSGCDMKTLVGKPPGPPAAKASYFSDRSGPDTILAPQT